MGKERKVVNIDGNTAAAHVAHATNEVIAIYPITPSSVMGEISDEKSARGEKNIWGKIPSVVELQSEAGAAGTVHGALSAGTLTTTFTASQGLLLMIPNMYKIAGECTPTVFHVSARALAAQALSIFGDHSDVMACRATGWIMFCSNNPQEVMDSALISQAVTLRASIPVLHFFDGFRTSHEMAMVELLTHEDMRSMIDENLVREHRRKALSPDRPKIKGTAQNPDVYFQGRETANLLYDNVAKIMQEEMDKFAALTGRQYHPVEYYGAPDAEEIIVIMGSAADVTEEAIDELAKAGKKYGVVKIRLFMPFPNEAFINILPKTTKRIATLDRTKEPGSNGEPLYQLIRTAIGEAMEKGTYQGEGWPKVVGGRYGLGSKDFTPAMVKAVYENLASEKPVNGFTVGIHDDVSNKSIPWDDSWVTNHDDRFSAMFYGLGSDGTVGANKNTAKIICEETDKNVQAYFVYDSKKSGSMTTSHLRFGKSTIKSSYLVNAANFIACHNFSFLEHYNILGQLKKGGTFLLNSQYGADTVWDNIPENVKKQIINTQARVFVIDAVEIGERLGLGARVNMILQAAFFKISNIIPEDTAKKAIEKAINKSYSKYGDKVVNMNINAMEEGFDNVHEVMYPGRVDTPDNAPVKKLPFVVKNHCTLAGDAPELICNTIGPLIANEGDNIKVSQIPMDGAWPLSTTRYEKRNIAVNIPVWNPDICTQCAMCSFICPHAAIRLKVYDNECLEAAPETFKSTEAKGKDFAGMKATVQVAAEDCTGCGLCVEACPVVNKADTTKKAIYMQPQLPLRAQEAKNFDFFINIPELAVEKYTKTNLKGIQLAPHHFEFSGACAGCGETPYVRLMTQLFGDRMIIANATGCSSIYGGNLPTTPYCTRNDGRGPSWSNSLFEDNAEFGFGMQLSAKYQREYACDVLKKIAGKFDNALVEDVLNAKPESQAEIEQLRNNVEKLKKHVANVDNDDVREFLSVADHIVPKSVWILGGDGWAYDIGYGGLDHVIASGENVNILVLDTEVYSNTGGQASKSTPIGANAKFASNGKRLEKKDLGMIAMTYGRVYVAHVSLSNPVQCIKAFIEAESFDGPSLIIAYSHCISHGIDMSKGVAEQKKAVQAGYWPLYRFDPRRISNGENPLQMDSKSITGSLSEFMQGENRFRITKKNSPEVYEELVKVSEVQTLRRFSMLEQLSKLDFTVKTEE